MLALDEEPIDGRDQRVVVDRLLQIRLGVDRRGLGGGIGAEREDRDGRELGVVFLRDAKLPAIHDGHHQVEEDDVRLRRRAKPVESLATVRAPGHAKALHGEQAVERFANVGVVLDDEERTARRALLEIRRPHAENCGAGVRHVEALRELGHDDSSSHASRASVASCLNRSILAARHSLSPDSLVALFTSTHARPIPSHAAQKSRRRLAQLAPPFDRSRVAARSVGSSNESMPGVQPRRVDESRRLDRRRHQR